jgi:hypothetical protein
MWKLLSTDTKKGNDNNEDTYVKELRRAGFLKVCIVIKTINVVGKRADVTLDMKIYSTNGKGEFVETHRDTWVNQGGKWLFDGSTTLEEKSPP